MIPAVPGSPAQPPASDAPASDPSAPRPPAPSPAAPTRIRLPRAATQQRLDPVGTLGAWPLAPVIAAIVVGYAVLATVLQFDQVRVPVLAVLAVLAVAAAAGVLVVVARPSRAPFERRFAVLMIALAVLAHLLEQASRWGSNERIQDDFGQICLGLLLMALGPFRPWREIALLGSLTAVVVAATALAQASSLVIIVPPAIYAIVAATQLLAPATASAAYSRYIVKSILLWQTDARRATRERTEEARGRVAQAVIAQRLEALQVAVLPFLNGVLEQGTLSTGDINRARALSQQLRHRLLAEVDRTWLETLVARERLGLTEQGRAPLLVVADPDARATDFEPDQRAATAALIVALCGLRGFDPASFVLQINGPDRPRRPGARRAASRGDDSRTPSRADNSRAPSRTDDSRAPSSIGESRTHSRADDSRSPSRTAEPLTSSRTDASLTAAPGRPATPDIVVAPSAVAPGIPTSAAASGTAPGGTAAEPRGPLRITPRPRATHGHTVTLQVRVDRPVRQLRAVLRPYLVVLRVTFSRVRVTYRHPSLVIEFDAVPSVNKTPQIGPRA